MIERIWVLAFHGILSFGSFQIMPDSCSFEYSPDILYRTMESSRAWKPWANPFGTKSDCPFPPVSSSDTHFPNVGESALMSTATSNIEPEITLTSFACSCGFFWKWSPLITPFVEEVTRSFVNSSVIPALQNAALSYLS